MVFQTAVDETLDGWSYLLFLYCLANDFLLEVGLLLKNDIHYMLLCTQSSLALLFHYNSKQSFIAHHSTLQLHHLQHPS